MAQSDLAYLHLTSNITSSGQNNGDRQGDKLTDIQKHMHRYKQLEQVISGASLGYWDWNCQTGEHHVNDRWLEILGLDWEDEKQHESDWSNRIHTEDKERIMPVIQSHIESGNTYVVEFRMKHKQGHWVWIQGSGSVVEYDHHNKPLRLYGTHQVITKRKLAEKELRRHWDHLQELVLERTADTEDNGLKWRVRAHNILIVYNKKGQPYRAGLLFMVGRRLPY